MDEILALRAWFETEGRVILDAPYVFGLAVIVIFYAAFRLASWWFERELKTKESTIDGLKVTHAAAMKLQEKHIEILQDENRAIQREIEKGNSIVGPSSLVPVNYGNATVQSAAVEIKQGSVIFYAPAEQWTEEQISKFAAYSRLRDAGLANIQIAPGTSTATVTASPVFLSSGSLVTLPRTAKGHSS